MSRLVRCNRCWVEGDVTLKPSGVAVVDAMAAFSGLSKFGKWSSLVLSPLAGMVKIKSATADLCEDCTEVLTEQFLKGARVEAITRPAGKHVMPHDDTLFQDCLLAFDPERGGLICEHDDPERFLWLQRNRIQNVAEGVPERKVCSECGCVAHREFGPCSSTGCECKVGLQAQVDQVIQDVVTAGYAHAVPQRCSVACSEAHTYREGCLLSNLVSDVPGQIMPLACGSECGEVNPDGSMPNPHHTYVLGKCLMNADTLRAIAVVCPVCKNEGSASGLNDHMEREHQMFPDYANHQWVGKDGRNLEGRLISSQGEDLTEAYSEQEPAEEESEFPAVPGVDYQVPQQRTETD